MLVGNGHTGGQCVKRDTSFCGSSHCRWKKKRKRKEIEWENGLDSMGNGLGNKKTGHWTLF